MSLDVTQAIRARLFSGAITRLTADTYRPAARFANYPGDCRGNLGQLVGVNAFGEILQIVSEEYDPAADRTRLGFAFGLPTTTEGATS